MSLLSNADGSRRVDSGFHRNLPEYDSTDQWYIVTTSQIITYSSKLLKFNFQPLEVVPRYRDSHLQVT